MKNNSKFFFTSLFSIALLALAGCGQVPGTSVLPSETPSEPTSELTSETVSEDTSKEEVPSETTTTPTTTENGSIADDFDCITIEKAIELATAAGEEGTPEAYFIYGKIKEVSNPQYGEMTITDGTLDLYVYGIIDYSTMEVKPLKGDEVVLEGKLKTFNGKPEMQKSHLRAHKVAEKEPVDDNDYVAMSIAEARKANVDAKVKITGVVATITRTQGNIPNGFILIDNSEAIYVYGKDAVQEVNLGNQATILGTRSNFVNPKEADFANKYGYQGSIQINNAIVFEHDNIKHDFNKTWVKDTTVKKIINTPTSDNITGSVFHVQAFINEVPGAGFTNFYINDLDGKTGSYVYSSNSGNDFAYLREFDKQLCDVYLSPINCKCTPGGIVYRFHPISVELSDYVMPDNEVPAFAIEYYGIDQFLDVYNADPALNMVENVTNELININDVKLTYKSSNENVVNFAKENNELIMHTKQDGAAEITITASYKNYAHSVSKNIEVKNVIISNTIDVKTALLEQDKTEVTIKGIVMSSLVNQPGFYIGDETGVIAVTGDLASISKLNIGDMVTVKGIKDHRLKEGMTDMIGQGVIRDSEILLNEYGEHQRPTASFNDKLTLKDIANFPVSEDHTNQVYLVDVEVDVINAQYYSAISLVSPTDENVKLSLYCSSAKQYSFLNAFAGQTVKAEICISNWNSKSHYKCDCLAVYSGDTVVYNTYNFK